jgi:hypothetical protein
MNQIINMVIHHVMRQIVHRGVNAGFEQAGKVGKRLKPTRGGADEQVNDQDSQR